MKVLETRRPGFKDPDPDLWIQIFRSGSLDPDLCCPIPRCERREGLVFEDWGLGVRVGCLGSRLGGSGFGDEGVGCRVQGVGCRV